MSTAPATLNVPPLPGAPPAPVPPAPPRPTPFAPPAPAPIAPLPAGRGGPQSLASQLVCPPDAPPRPSAPPSPCAPCVSPPGPLPRCRPPQPAGPRTLASTNAAPPHSAVFIVDESSDVRDDGANRRHHPVDAPAPL